MADLNVTADFSDLTDLKRVLTELGPIATAMVSKLVRENKRLTQSLKADAQVQRQAIEMTIGSLAQKEMTEWGNAQRRRIALMQESERMAQKEIATTLRQRDAQAQLAAAKANSYQSNIGGNLGLSSNGTDAAASAAAMSAEMDRLRSKYDGIYASSKRYEVALEELNMAHRMGVFNTKQYEAAVENLNVGMLTNGTAAQATRQRMSQLGVVTQQAGYQVGDFLVQIQSGTNPMVAFGQQATQLAGLMTTFGGKFIFAGTALGILIPLATALGALWMRTSKDTDTASEATKNMESSLKSLDKTLQDWTLSKQAAAAGVTVEELFGAQSVDDAIANMDRAKAAYDKLLADIAATENVSSGMGPGANAGVALYNMFAIGSLESDIEAASKAYTDAMVRVRALEQKNGEERVANFEEQRQLLLEQQAIEIATAKYGRESVSVKELLAAKERKVFEETLKTNKLNESMVTVLMQQYDTGIRNVAVVKNWQTNIEAIKGVLDSINGMQLTVGLQINAAVSGLPDFATGIWDKMGELGKKTKGAYQQYGDTRSQADSPTWAGFKSVEDSSSGSSGGGGGGGGNAALESLISELQTEQETLAIWYEESQTALQSASDAELSILGGKHESMLRLTEEYVKRKSEIEEMSNQWSLESAVGGAAEIFGALGAFNKKALKAQAVFAAGAALISTYQGAAKELEKGTLGFTTAAAVIAKGLGFVAAIKSAGDGGGGGRRDAGGGGRGVSTVAPSEREASPQTVYIDSITPESLYSGQTLMNLFDSFYNENDRRGKVFVVAR